MRSSFVVASLFIAGTAAADPELVVGPSDTAPTVSAYARQRETSGMWIDFGVGVDRVAPGNGGVYSGQFVRFAPQVTLNRHFYLGAELDIGSFDGNAVANDSNNAARGSGSVMAPAGVTGTTGAAMALLGARANAGIVSGGVELAGGIRNDVVTNYSMVSNAATRGVIEAHGRLDLRVTPLLSIGGMVGTDLTDKDNMTATLQLGFHTTR